MNSQDPFEYFVKKSEFSNSIPHLRAELNKNEMSESQDHNGQILTKNCSEIGIVFENSNFFAKYSKGSWEFISQRIGILFDYIILELVRESYDRCSAIFKNRGYPTAHPICNL